MDEGSLASINFSGFIVVLGLACRVDATETLLDSQLDQAPSATLA
jgi:hypothetical protein